VGGFNRPGTLPGRCEGGFIEDSARPARVGKPALRRRTPLARGLEPSDGALDIRREEVSLLGRQRRALAQEAEQQVFGADLGVAETLGLFSSGGQDPARALRYRRCGHVGRE
jgi:hypothetical protein